MERKLATAGLVLIVALSMPSTYNKITSISKSEPTRDKICIIKAIERKKPAGGTGSPSPESARNQVSWDGILPKETRVPGAQVSKAGKQ